LEYKFSKYFLMIPLDFIGFSSNIHFF
jgi:hypothetical protein